MIRMAWCARIGVICPQVGQLFHSQMPVQASHERRRVNFPCPRLAVSRPRERTIDGVELKKRTSYNDRMIVDCKHSLMCQSICLLYVCARVLGLSNVQPHGLSSHMPIRGVGFQMVY